MEQHFQQHLSPKLGGEGAAEMLMPEQRPKKRLCGQSPFSWAVTHVEGLYNINLLRSPNSTIRYNIPSPKQRHGLWDDKHTPAQSYGERRCHVWHAGPSEGPCGKDAD
jgi:hypothetical protein